MTSLINSPDVEDLPNLLNNASIAIHLVNKEGIIIWANHLELETLGYAAEEYVGHSITEFHVDEEVINDILTLLLDGHQLEQYPARLKASNGATRYSLINSNVFEKNGEFKHTRCFTMDITEQVFNVCKTHSKYFS